MRANSIQRENQSLQRRRALLPGRMFVRGLFV
jgi:hypothetical protein